MNIITGYRGEPHITSQQLRNTYIPIFGPDAKIIDVGSKMAFTVISANEIEIADGQLICEGCMAEIAYGTSETIMLENGAQGMQRKDLIVARYTKNSGTGVEDMQLAVVKGTPAATNPAVPSYNTGTIADGDSPVDFPIYVVNISGISVAGVERLAEVRSIPGKFEAVDRKFENVEGEINGIRLNMGGVKIKAVRRTVTIPSGSNNMSETTINFASDLPNARLVGVDITIGDFHMPYSMNGTTVGTWISRLRAQSIVINNTVGAYNNYTMTALLFYVDTVV